MTVLAEYDEAWPGQFAEMAERLRAVFGDTVTELEHIGSTAVPGLVAKPVIDIAARAVNLEVAAGKDPGLAALGFPLEPAGPPGDAPTPASSTAPSPTTSTSSPPRPGTPSTNESSATTSAKPLTP
ncbi:GrpB protein [Kribbella orskensis]|uniref:GrpB protein n=1 Tax=Kribbella orskensis TaxID=2512216 RepID=A0ABY2BND7_9ACTN|nr:MULTISPECIES: GrpB family protein [Kribbella]TCN40385.1 GrpB protein [Kribbella sp. VKM Ac-2500]TCO23005.1 GrpB protein [Kribbella orskensis]